MALLDTTIRKAKPHDKPYKLTDSKGLYISIQPKAGKWWRFRYRFDGKEKLLFLGTYLYRRAKRIHLVLDNYIIHKALCVRDKLELLGGRIVFHFLPPYSPQGNLIERLWKQLHDHVTRNHQHRTISTLVNDVRKFLDRAQPFPGTQVSTLRMTL